MTKVAAVTGGGGFIGRRLVARLTSAGYRVRVLTRNSQNKCNSSAVSYFQGDLVASSEAHLSTFLDGVDVLYHCAAEILDESKMTAVNFEGTKKLARAAKGRISRWVQLSTAGVYGADSGVTITEESLPKPANVYESTKLDADLVMLEVLSNSGIVWSILRPTIVYGVDMPNNSFRALINAVLNKRFFYIGKNGAILPYIHVDNVVNALILCGEHDEAIGEIFNLSDDVTIENFVQSIAKIKGRKLHPIRLPECIVRSIVEIFSWHPRFPLTKSRIDALTRRVQYPTNKIRIRLGFTPVKGFYNGLKEMIELNSI
jgi:nucleoside-diphosphate-sugar epimerase